MLRLIIVALLFSIVSSIPSAERDNTPTTRRPYHSIFGRNDGSGGFIFGDRSNATFKIYYGRITVDERARAIIAGRSTYVLDLGPVALGIKYIHCVKSGLNGPQAGVAISKGNIGDQLITLKFTSSVGFGIHYIVFFWN